MAKPPRNGNKLTSRKRSPSATSSSTSTSKSQNRTTMLWDDGVDTSPIVLTTEAESSTAPTSVACPNLVIRASAGTGKTFQLSNRYLTLLDRGVPVDQILATTFTRKAAGEILDRIV